VDIVHKRELNNAPEAERGKLREEKIAEFRSRFANPFVAAERGYLDAVIEPARRGLASLRRCGPWKTSATPIRKRSTPTFRCDN